MRTCPNCGKDTEADMTAACTECGWSPVGSAEAGAAEPAPAPKRARVGTVWIVLILIGLAWQAFNFFDGCGEIFDEKRNASADSVTVVANDEEGSS